jgi:hypothetical protein
LLAAPLTAFVKLVADCHPALLPISNLRAETPRPGARWAQASRATVTRAIPYLPERLDSGRGNRKLYPNVRFSFFLANSTHVEQPLHKYYKGMQMLVLRWHQM